MNGVRERVSPTTASHDPYLIPGTDCLHNKLGIENATELREREGHLAIKRELQLAQLSFHRTYDLEHLCFLHRWLFQDVYHWAGQTRNVPINKDGSEFAQPQFITSEADRIFTQFRRQSFLRNVSDDRLAARLAELFGDINALHPFREGNGRVQRLFLSQLVSTRGYELAWHRVGPKKMIAASIASYRGDQAPIEDVFARIMRKA